MKPYNVLLGLDTQKIMIVVVGILVAWKMILVGMISVVLAMEGHWDQEEVDSMYHSVKDVEETQVLLHILEEETVGEVMEEIVAEVVQHSTTSTGTKLGVVTTTEETATLEQMGQREVVEEAVAVVVVVEALGVVASITTAEHGW